MRRLSKHSLHTVVAITFHDCFSSSSSQREWVYTNEREREKNTLDQGFGLLYQDVSYYYLLLNKAYQPHLQKSLFLKALLTI